VLRLNANAFNSKQGGFHLAFEVEVQCQIANPEIVCRPQSRTQKARSKETTTNVSDDRTLTIT